MKKDGYTLFIVSDVHGYFNELVKALDEAEYDENNPKHKLICLGDIFDRGSQALAVYEYLYRLTQEEKAIVISGNHHKFLIDYLDGTNTSPFNYRNNGVDETLADFLGRTDPFESWCLIDKQIKNPTIDDFETWIDEARKEINDTYPELLPWLKSLPRYFESEHYIGVHGALDTMAEDWHNPHCNKFSLSDWDALEFDDGSFFGEHINNTDKTIIIGHFGTCHLREKYNINANGDKYGILTREDGKVIAIDATTVLSNKVNVLVIENEKI